ncbi:probable RNA-directed DNA polymerase from transposon X-element [Trichonephila clavipes]|nr:probable RNA-directed DNA polymerase from transposon X-element [Trichonephila clavipes]
MDEQVDDQCINMEDNESYPPLLTDESRCLSIHGIDKEIRIFSARKNYVTTMQEIERSSPSPVEETTKKLEKELLNLETKLQTLEGKMTEFLLCPIAQCMHNNKIKAIKRSADPIIRPAKFTAKANKNLNNKSSDKDFVFPKKTAKNISTEKKEQVNTNNSFAALNTANKDAEDVTQPPLKINPIFMRITPNYNLLLQEIHRTHPTAKNTHMKGYFKIEAETEDHHREITEYLTTKNMEYYVINPPDNRPLKLVIKGLPDDVEPDDIKKDLISKGELKHLFKERNRARKIWQLTRHPQDKTALNRLQNAIKRKVNLYRQQVWEDHLTSLDTEDCSLWGTAKAFRRKAAPISALNGPTGTALSDTHKTELIAQSLESQFQLHDIQNSHKDEYITNTVDAYFTANTNNIDQLPPTFPSETISYIKKIKIRKSPGRDGITNKRLKYIPLITIFKITNIINNMLNLRYFPSAWKTAVLVPILKPGKDPTLAESHRPISLLPILSKLAEKSYFYQTK